MVKTNLVDSIRNILIYLCAVILVINSQSVWMTIPGLSDKLTTICFFSLVLLIGLIIFIQIVKQSKIDLERFSWFLGLFSIFMFIYIIVSNQNVLFCIKIYLVIILFDLLLSFDEGEVVIKILLAYKNLLFFVAIISLFFWLNGSILHILTASSVIQSKWGAFNNNSIYFASYHNLYFETQYMTIPVFGTICRNTAVFPEAPMASLNFSIAFLIEETIKNNKYHKAITAVLVLAIVTTFSTTGYILLIFYFVIKWLRDSKTNLGTKILMLLPLVVVTALIFVVIANQKVRYGNLSMQVRWDDYIVGVQTWLRHPFFGSGLSNQQALNQSMESWRIINSGFSNSITEVLAEGGLYISGFYVYCFIRGIYHSVVNKDEKFLIFTIGIIYLFIFTIFTYNYILLLLLVLLANLKILKD